MTELTIAVVWASAFTYAVWSIRQSANAFIASRKVESDNEKNAKSKAEIDYLLGEVKKAQRTANQAALAAGLREDGK
jgi:hypothetical protein